MNFYAVSALIDSAIMILLFFILLLKKDKPRAAKYFNMFNVAGILWAVPYYFWQTSTDYDTALFWVKMLMVGAILAPPMVFHFATVITEKEKNFREITILFYYLALIFIYLDFFSDNFITGLQTKLSIPFFPTAGPYYIFYILQWIAILVAAFWIIYRRSLEVKDDARELLQVIMVSTAISFAAGAVNYFLWFNIPIPPVTTLITGLYAVAGTIMLLQGKFYKINLFYFEYFAGVTVIASLLQFVLSRQLPPQYVSAIIIFIILIATVFLVRNSKAERDNLEKIKLLNERLSESLTNMINSIDALVLIINKENEVEIANETALKFFCLDRESCPKKFFDFVQGNTNQALITALTEYRKNGKPIPYTTILSPQVKSVNLFFSLFTLKNENDATLVIMKDQKS